MPSRVEDYDVLYTIGSGSYGRCRKIRRKSDGKVSQLLPQSYDNNNTNVLSYEPI